MERGLIDGIIGRFDCACYHRRYYSKTLSSKLVNLKNEFGKDTDREDEDIALR